MITIGLTGGIASGKSTVAESLKTLGAVVIDADRLGHRVYEPDSPGFEKVVNAFGHDVVSPDGSINRRVLGGKVFGDPEQMDRLTDISWPEIRRIAVEEIAEHRRRDPGAIIVFEAAVLLEAGWTDFVDEVWVVTAPSDTVRGRLLERFGGDEEAIAARVRSQMPQEDRRRAADAIIDNDGSVEDLRSRVERVFSTRIKAAREHTNHK